MSQPTTTRKVMRQHLARRLRMPFAVRIGDSSVLTGGTTTTAIDTARLVQTTTDLWKNQYFYNVTRDATRQITAFNSSTKALTLDAAIAAQTTGDVYEIHSIWSANDLHYAINQALHAAFPSFFEYVTDETLVYQENDLTYNLTGLAKPLWRLSKIFMEWNASVLRGVPTAATASTLTDTSLIGGLAAVTSAWKVGIYAGTGAGGLASVVTANNGTGQLAISPNWSVTPDTTSKYALWNPALQKGPWLPVTYGRPDQAEWPSNFYYDFLVPTSYGLRMRLRGAAQPVDFAADSDTSFVPEEYVLLKAASILFSMMVDDNRVDRQRYAALGQDYNQQSEQFRTTQYFRPPDGQWWSDGRPVEYMDAADPLGWRAGRRDF